MVSIELFVDIFSTIFGFVCFVIANLRMKQEDCSMYGWQLGPHFISTEFVPILGNTTTCNCRKPTKMTDFTYNVTSNYRQMCCHN